MVSFNQKIPKYLKIKESIRQDIESGRLKVGEQLASEGALIQQFSASKMTVIRALQDLVGEGYLNRIQGKGTFVIHPEKDSSVIGVVFPACNTMMQGIFPTLLHTVEKRIHELGYQMSLCCGDDCDKIMTYAKRTIKNKISGIIAAPIDGMTKPEVNMSWYKLFYESDIPVVLIDNAINGIDNAKIVRTDHTAAMEEITHNVIKIGHKRILLICWENIKSQTVEFRIQGFKNSVKQLNQEIDFSEIISLSSKLSNEDQKVQIKTIIDQFDPSCILAIDDYLALKVCTTLEQLQEPYNQISVTGFDDLPFASTIGLTTIKQPIIEQGNKTVDLLHSLISGYNAESLTIPSQLVMRQTLQPFSRY